MKKALPVIIVICLIAVIIGIHQMRQPSKPVESLPGPIFATDIPIGKPVTFEVKYRGITGKKDDLRPYSFSGYGEARDYTSSFIEDVKKVVQDPIVVIRHPYLKTNGMEFSAVAYKDRKALAFYIDLNGDGVLSEGETLTPVKGWDDNQSDLFNFVTPDFAWTNKTGVEMPFRVLLRVHFYGDPADMNAKPSVVWSPMGLYEGQFTLNDKKLRFYLFAGFYSQGYMTFGQSDYALVPADRKQSDYVPRRTLSSLVVNDKTFYRVNIQACEDDVNTLIVSLAEDKSPRGKVAIQIEGGKDFKYRLNNANLEGAADETIYFTISGGMDELPVGQYLAPSGYLMYDKDADENYDYHTSFRDIPAFSIKADETTTVEMGKPEVKLQAIELTKRYQSDKKYKIEFPEGTDVYIDAAFPGKAGETYSSFTQRVQKQNYSTDENIKARIKIVDAAGNEIANQELEYG